MRRRDLESLAAWQRLCDARHADLLRRVQELEELADARSAQPVQDEVYATQQQRGAEEGSEDR